MTKINRIANLDDHRWGQGWTEEKLKTQQKPHNGQNLKSLDIVTIAASLSQQQDRERLIQCSILQDRADRQYSE